MTKTFEFLDFWWWSNLAFPSDAAYVVLFASIAGIVGISVYTLYAQDKLASRVADVEQYQLEDAKEEEAANQAKKDNTDSVESLKHRIEEELVSLNERLLRLSSDLSAEYLRIERLAKDIDENRAIGSSFHGELRETSAQVQTMINEISETNSKVEALQDEVRDLSSRLQRVEGESEEAIRKAESLSEL